MRASGGGARRGRAALRAAIGVIGLALVTLAGVVVWGPPGWLRPVHDPLALGRSAYDRGDWSTAADQAKTRLAQVPGDLESLRLLARSSAQLGRDDSAQALFGRLGSERWDADDYVLLGRILERKGQPSLAVDAWEMALVKSAEHPEALASLIATAARKAQHERAAVLAERLAARPGWSARGLTALATARSELGDPAAAATALERALALDANQLDSERRGAVATLEVPSRAVLQARLARAQLQLGQPDAASATLAGTPTDDPEAAWLRSRIALQKGDATAAAAWLDRAGDYRGAHPWEPEPALYVGEQACAGCHRSVHTMHRGTMHDRTFHRAAELARLTRPAPSDTADPAAPEAGVAHTLDLDASPPTFQTRVDGATFRAIVDYAFGSGDRGLTLVGRDADSPSTRREMRLSRYADAATPGHWDVTTGHHPRPDAPHGWLGRTLSPDQARGCLDCHTTDPHAIVTGKGPQAADRAIGCERCHGPGGNHLAAVAARLPDLAIAGETGLSTPAQINRQCGRCHSPPGDEPVSPSSPASIRFQATTLTWSRCYTDSGEALSCLTCHNPHRDASTKPASYEARCRSCHGAGAEAGARSGSTSAAQATTCPVNPTSDCIRCHMPLTRTAEIPHSPFTDHFIRIHRELGPAPAP